MKQSINLCVIFLFATSCCWFNDCDDNPSPDPDPIYGCMDRTAPNYKPTATHDDGSCISCDPVERRFSNSFNTYTFNGAPVANFKLEQINISYNPACSEQSSGPVKLTVTSTAFVPLRIDFLLQGLGASGLVIWSYSHTIPRLVPNETYIIPQVVDTPVRVDLGARVFFQSVIQVP